MGRFLGVVAAAAWLAGMGGGSAAGATAGACQMVQIGELPVRFDDGMVTVDAQINGKPVRMIVDTGAEITVLFRPSAKALGLRPKRVDNLEFYGVGGKSDAGVVRVKEFKVAQFSAPDEDLIVTGENALGGAVGLLGSAFLLQADVEFDLPDKMIRFFAPKNCVGDQVVYWGKAYSVASMTGSSDKNIYVVVTLNGVRLVAEMDTGSSSTAVTVAGAAKAGVTPGSSGIEAVGSSVGMGAKRERTFEAVFGTFGFGDETIKNARLDVADLFEADTEVGQFSRTYVSALDDAPQMLLGADFFKAHRVYVSRAQKKVYISYMGGRVFDTPRSEPAEAKPPTPPAAPH